MVVPHHTSPRHYTWCPMSKHVVIWGLALRRLCSCRRIGDPVLVTGRFLWPQHKHGTLPVSLQTASSFLTFRRELKTFLFNISFPDKWTLLQLLDIVKGPCSFSIVGAKSLALALKAKSLALASKVKSLALTLALEAKSLALALRVVALTPSLVCGNGQQETWSILEDRSCPQSQEQNLQTVEHHWVSE